jgi:hypothetical protein
MHTIQLFTGSTCVGKSRLAVKRAEAIGATVVPIDQLQQYRDLEVGVGLDLELLSRVRTFGYRVRSPWEVVKPAAYVAWLAENVGRLAQQRPVVIEGGCTSYLAELLRTRASLPILRSIDIVELRFRNDPAESQVAIMNRCSVDLIRRVVTEMSCLKERGYFREDGLGFFAECERIFTHPEHPDPSLAWALRISAKVYYPAILVLLNRLSLHEASSRIGQNTVAIHDYQLRRLETFKNQYPGIIRTCFIDGDEGFGIE